MSPYCFERRLKPQLSLTQKVAVEQQRGHHQRGGNMPHHTH